MTKPGDKDSIELTNFEAQTVATIPLPGDLPELDGLDIYGESIQKTGRVGGDHIIFVDFKKRYNLGQKKREALKDDRLKESARLQIVQNIEGLKKKGGILIADVAGHFRTDFSFATRLHDAFLIAVLYEIEGRGDITPNLFRKLNTRLYNSSTFDKYITMIYGEISVEGVFKFISAGHPFPLLFKSEHNRLFYLRDPDLKPSPPLAAFPSQGLDMESNVGDVGFYSQFEVNTLHLEQPGDILLLYTDGLSELRNTEGEVYYTPESGGRLQEVFQANKNLAAQELFTVIKEDLLAFAKPDDDVSYVLIKRQ